MKVNKINKEFLDLIYKKKTIAMDFDEKNGKVYLTDTYKLFVINFEDFIFRFDLFRKASLIGFNDDTNYLKGIITDVIYKDEDKIEKRLITSEDGAINIKVNNKYLEYFDKPKVKVLSDDKPILIYENDKFVGLILPIKEY